jgi:hypothetical protein
MRPWPINIRLPTRRVPGNAHFKITAAIAETIQHKTTLTTKTLTLTVKPSKKSSKK